MKNPVKCFCEVQGEGS